MADEKNQDNSSSSNEQEPKIRSRVFFKENFNQEEPVIRTKVIMKSDKKEQ